MPTINFKKQFAPAVEALIKRQTIRRKGKRTYRVGDTLHAYTGLRTRVCRKLGIFKIKEILEIHFWPDKQVTINVQGEYKNPLYAVKSEAADDLARRDGFKSFKELEEWFLKQYGDEIYVTEFQAIRW